VTTVSSVVPPAEGARDQIVYIGSKFVFPDVMLRLVENEIGDIETRRMEVAGFDTLEAPVEARLLVFEEGYGAALFEKPERMQALCGVSVPVLAYRDPDVARALLYRQQYRAADTQIRFLPQEMPIEGMIGMLRVLLSGEIMVPAALVARGEGRSEAKGQLSDPSSDHPACETLTPRENEVLHLAAKGQRNKVIANALGVSEHTVKLHIHHIIAKLGVANRTEAANRYMAAQMRGR
jgi:DNA-binding CsgD family transcriptional regulator